MIILEVDRKIKGGDKRITKNCLEKLLERVRNFRNIFELAAGILWPKGWLHSFAKQIAMPY
jgi:hypothetical protein